MIPFFVQIKCELGKSYSVANAIADAEIASEVYSTAGDFDLLVKFYVEDFDRHRALCERKGAGDPGHQGHLHDHHVQGVRVARPRRYVPLGGTEAARARARSNPSWRSRQITYRPEPATMTAPT